MPIGRVESVNLDKGGVVAIAAINGSVKLPVDSEVRVSGLSPAGEQYLDFRPTTNNGPFLGNNSVVALGKATTPITLAQVLADSDGLLAQLDTQKLSTLRKELGSAHRVRRNWPTSSTVAPSSSPPLMACFRRR